jgi:hypothetical protein
MSNAEGRIRTGVSSSGSTGLGRSAEREKRREREETRRSVVGNQCHREKMVYILRTAVAVTKALSVEDNGGLQ